MLPALHRGARALALAAIAACAPETPAAPDPAPPTQVPDSVGRLLWLQGNARPLERLALGGSLADLRPLEAMIGTARVVGMGEATHGSREFFTVKARVFEFLVREMGFTGLAVEGMLPEAHALDVYVRTGAGDARALLANLYYWTLRHDELLELVEWMRAYNRGQPAERQVGFYGFDEQFPGTAMDSVIAYVGRVAGAPSAAWVRGRYECAWPFRNFGHPVPGPSYAATPADARAACRASLRAVADSLAAWRPVLVAGSSAAEYDLLARFAQVVLQWEAQGSSHASGGFGAGYTSRDSAMAANVHWILQRLGASAKLMLWAHNGHVGMHGPDPAVTQLGAFLRRDLGRDYVPAGFAFNEGRLFAGDIDSGVYRSWLAPTAPDSTYESVLRRAGPANYYVDMRTAPEESAAARWLDGPGRLREVGAAYSEARWTRYFYPIRLRKTHDLLFFIDRVQAASVHDRVTARVRR